MNRPGGSKRKQRGMRKFSNTPILKKFIYLRRFVVLLFVLGVIGGSSYALYRQANIPRFDKDFDKTLGWKTYVNAKYKWSIMYPKELHNPYQIKNILLNKNDPIYLVRLEDIISSEISSVYDQHLIMEFQVLSNDNHLDLSQFADQRSSLHKWMNRKVFREIRVNKVKAYHAIFTQTFPYSQTYFYLDRDHILRIESTVDEKGVEKFAPLQDAILSTFTFLDKRQSIPTTQCTEEVEYRGELSSEAVYKTYYDLSEALSEPESVCTLSLSDENLDKVPSKVYKLKNLENLYLYSKKIIKVDKGITQLKNLKTLYIGGNFMSDKEIERVKKMLPNTDVSNF